MTQRLQLCSFPEKIVREISLKFITENDPLCFPVCFMLKDTKFCLSNKHTNHVHIEFVSLQLAVVVFHSTANWRS